MPTLQAPELNVPKCAAQHYRTHAYDMATMVSQRLAQHEQFENFLGNNPVQLLTINHHNHAAFVAEVLASNHYRSLAQSLPWVYAAYHHQGVPFEYFLVELELWQQVIRNTLPPEAADAVLPVYDWMIQAHPHTIVAAQHHQSARLDVPADYQAHFEQLWDDLLHSRYPQAVQYCRELLAQGMSYQRLMHDLIYPIMVEVGARWEQGKLSVATEHQITAIVYALLATLYQEQDFVPMNGGRAVIAAVTQEFHQLGAWMLATHLELEGWDVTQLDSPVSVVTLTETVVHVRPHIVALSVTMVSNVHAAHDLVAAVRHIAAEHDLNTRIAVGGRAFSVAPDLAERLAPEVFRGNASEFIEWARGLDL